MVNAKSVMVSIIIPVFGSEKILPELFNQINQVMKSFDLHYEVIFICDNSPDGSWLAIQNLAKRHDCIGGILLRMNAGQHNALMAGLTSASGNIIVTMDDDLQHSPSDIPCLIEHLMEGYDVVYAKFRVRKHALWKKIGSKINNAVAGYLLNKPSGLYLSPFRAFKSSIKDEILRYQGPYVYIDGLILSVTSNISSVEVHHYDRLIGQGNYGFIKSISLWLKMATNFSIIPLRLTSIIGLLFSSVGFILALLFIIQKFTLDMMPIGWSSLIVTILIIGGVQLLALGMIGEYLGRVLLTINARPQYVISEKFSRSSSEFSNFEKN